MLDFNTQDSDWLEDAIWLDVVSSKSKRLRRLNNHLFSEITPFIKVSSKHRQKEALKTILINLSQAREVGKPVRYSRNKNDYTRDKRYGQLHFKYSRLIPIIKALAALGYIEHKNGFFYRGDKQGKQSRMWGTDRLWALFQEYRISQPVFFQVKPAGECETIILRNETKQDIGYRETKQTRCMRDDLDRINTSNRKHKVSLRLPGSTLVDYRFLVEDIYQYIKKVKVWIKEVQFSEDSPLARTRPLPIPGFTRHLQKFIHNPVHIISNLLDSKPTSTTTITNTKWSIATARATLRRYLSDEGRFEKYLAKRNYEIRRIPWKDRKAVLAEKYTLRDIGVDMLEISLDDEQLHRIFNRKSWKLGGRAYGALHQDWVRREMRQHILIDGVPTVEVDYSAYHILMLYHRKGIDYREDPYAVCEGPEMRKTYKAVGLIAINAGDNREAYGAISEELESQGIPLPQRRKPLVSLVRAFREAHKPIAEYLFSGVGTELQNTDSNIMNAILIRLLDHGILGLSVYDSVIVQQQYEDLLRTIMVEEYRREMGFDPRIDD